MALRINTNVAAINAHKNMINNDNALSSSLEKLSSGLRINRAADDASGMAIADSLKSQALGLGQAIRNANDGISMVQTADGALDESIKIVNTIKTKAIQAAQDGQTTESRLAIQADINKLMEELNSIANTTAFNNQKLLSGQFTNKRFQIGAYTGETVGISIGSAESTKVGHVTTAEMVSNSANGGEVRLSIFSNTQNMDVKIQSVQLAYDNSADHSMGALAAAINKVADMTGVSAQAKVSSSSSATVNAGSTGSDFSINGVVIGEVRVLANDADGSLVNAINQKSSQHGIVASVDQAGYLSLTSNDGRAIQVTGDTGAVLVGSNLSTFGSIKLFQTGANEIRISDEADAISLNLTGSVGLSTATTTLIDSTITKNSTIGSASVLKAGTQIGFVLTSTTLNGTISTTMDSILTAGSVLASATMIEMGSVLGGTTTRDQDSILTTTSDSLLKTGTTLKSGTKLAAGTTVTTRLKAATGWIEAGDTINSEVTLSGSQTLNADMVAKSQSVMASANVFTAGSYIGADMTTASTIATTLDYGMTLLAGSEIADGGLSIKTGSIIGGNITISAALVTTTADTVVKAGSSLTATSILAKGSTIGGNVKTSTAVTLASSMTLAAGSQIASGSTMKAGTVLTDNIWVAGGNQLKAGTVLTGDTVTSGTNYLNNSLTLAANSIVAAASVFAPMASASTGATATTSLSNVSKFRLADVDVTSQDSAQVAISIADSALKNLDKIRSDLGSVQNQLTSTITNLSVTRVNIYAAESAIRDVDFAEEAANFSKMQILSQSSSFAMAQANASAQTVLSLLQG
ncbi:MAG: flagellar protein FlaB [Proteobacteria bacterium]|nr:flagellar protein FlaB [Pseudomonadota bacterium]MBU1686220.1 flagellar protein FlaB [Pseudomonadota bacterium]